MFRRSRTAEGRARSTCTRCGTSQASWSDRTLSRWQQAHQCNPSQVSASPAT